MESKTVGDKINELLEVRGMRQADLARLTGISKGHLSDVCSNKKTSVMLDTIRKIAKALNIHPAYFLEEDTVGPSFILEHLTQAQRQLILDPERGLPWIKLSEKAAKKGLSPEKIERIINAIIEE